MFNPVHFENSRPDGCSALEILGGYDGETPGHAHADRHLFVPLKMSYLRGEIAGPLATLSLTQTFHYTAEECDRTLEAAYRFPLPGDVAVIGVTVRFGKVVIAAELMSRREAEAAYAEAKAKGRQTALASRESPDVFTLLVAGIQPDQPIEVETRYVQLARSNGSEWSIRIPLTTAPRYLRSDELGSAPARGQPLLVLRDPGHRFRLELAMDDADADAGDVVSSPTHELTTERKGDKVTVTLATGEVLPDRDCVLAWRPRQQPARPTLDVHTHLDHLSPPPEGGDDQVYFLAAIAPPIQPAEHSPIPREIILLVDHSGSMTGAKWAAADWAVERFLGELHPYDHFALGIFHTSTHWFAQELQPAGDESVQRAVTWLQGDKESGGTALGTALEQALQLPRAGGDMARHVLVFTDAAVTDAARILRLVDSEAARPTASRRISVLCIDAAPNAYLANAMAERGGGVARFLTSAPEEHDITTALDETLTIWAEPQLVDVRLGVDRAEVAANRRAARGDDAGWSYLDLGDLTAGQAVWVCGRAPAAGRDELAVRLLADDDAIVTATRGDLNRAPPLPALKALFGAYRINELEYLINAGYDRATLVTHLDQLGYDGAAVMNTVSDQVYAENRRLATADALRTLLIQEALDYGLPSSETSFVAIRSEAGKRVEATIPVANALPSGWSGKTLAGMGMANIAAGPPGFGPTVGPAQMPASFAPGPGGPAMVNQPQPMLMPQASLSQGPPPGERDLIIFSGVPHFVHGRAVLFDTSDDDKGLPARTRLTQVRVEFTRGESAMREVDSDVKLLIFVGDLAEQRATVRLRDLVRYGKRPLNLRRQAGDIVRVELVDSEITPRVEAMELTVMLMVG